MTRNELAGRLENMVTDFRRYLGRDDDFETFIHRAEVDTMAAAAAALRDVAVTDADVNRGWHVLLEKWRYFGTLGVTKAVFRDALEAALSPKAALGAKENGRDAE